MPEQAFDKGSILFSWKALSFVTHQRTWMWYVLGSLISILMVSYAIFYEESWIMAVTLAALAAVTFLSLYEKPQELSAEICENGFSFRDEFYSYEKVKSFWFVKKTGHCSVNFDLTGRFAGIVSIHIKDKDLEKLRSTLSKYLPEDTTRKEYFFENLARRLKL